MKQKAVFNLSIFKRLVGFAKPYLSLLIIALIGSLSLSVLSTLRPKFIGDALQKYAIDEQTRNVDEFTFWMMIVGVMLLSEGILQFTVSYFSNLFAQNVIRDMRTKVFEHLMSFRMRYFDKTPVGNLITRVVADIEAISDVFSAGLVDVLGDLFILSFVLVSMFVQDWYLSILVLIPIPILLFATRLFAKAMKNSFQQEREAVNKLNTFIQERLTGMNIVQLFNRQEAEMNAFQVANKEHRTAHINAVWAFSIFFPVVELLSSLSFAFLIVWIASVISGDVNSAGSAIGKLTMFTFYVQMIYRPIRQLADKFNILQRGFVRAERVLEALDTTDHIQDEGSIAEADFNQPVTFKNVWFAYEDEKWVLKNLNFTFEPGKTVAFVGATGAGKTSIVNLLSRFYEYQKGDIFIGTHELREFQLATLRKNIAVVLQDVFLFSDSIHNNITLGNDSISREAVIAASKAVGAHEFIEKLPGGYDFQVGERGGILSVGQRQLLAFIRAYVYNPHILILDEATSSVDSESEAMIQKATEELTKGRTSIVIAHRLSTIQAADTIVVLDKGEIQEVGNHQELIKQEGYYKRLFDMQFKK